MRRAVVWALGLVGTGCLEGSEVGSIDRELTPVTWTAAVNADAAGDDLTKSAGGDAWNAGAVSVAALTGDGYVEFTTAENTTAKMAGLSSGNSDQSDEDIDFAVFLRADGQVAVSEAGVRQPSAGPYQPGDVFRVDVSAGVVTYARNGVVFHTSEATPSFPLLVDTSLRSPGATIRDAQLVDGSPVVFSNASLVFRWRPRCNCVETVPGRYLDLTRAAEDQDGSPRRTSIDFLKIDPSIGNITAGGFWFRSAMVDGEGVFFAHRKPFVIQGSPRDVQVIPPRKKQVGDTVGPDDTWIDGEPPNSINDRAGVQTAHFSDLTGDTGPDQMWFRDGIVGVRFRIDGAPHYGFVELNWVQPDAMFTGRYRPVRWGYNPIPDDPLVIPP